VVGFATATYFITRNILLDRQEQNFLEVVEDHSIRVEEFLLTSEATYSEADLISRLRDFISELSSDSGVQVLLRYKDNIWLSPNPLNLNRSALDPQLIETVSSGNSSIMRYEFEGELQQVAGVPLAGGRLLYFGIESTQNTADILNLLTVIIFVGSIIAVIVTTVIGGVLIRRSFATIGAFRRAAEDIREGSIAPISEPVDPDFEQLKDSFNRMQRAINRRIEREQQFALEVSHELRSPLTTIIVSLETLKSYSEKFPGQAQQALELLAVEVERFRQLLLDLLEISRPPESIILDLTFIDAQKFMKELLGQDVPIVLENSSIQFEGDEKLLSQVFLNLLRNAQEYADGATTVNVWREDDAIFFAMEDRGPGVEDEDKEKIFDRFTRGSVGLNRGKSSGTGLGLAIAKERVRLHNGDIWVEDVNSRGGARFVVKLPLTQPMTKSSDTTNIYSESQML